MRLLPELEAQCLAMADKVNGVAPLAPVPVVDTIGEAAFQRAVTDLAEQHGWRWHHQQISKRSKSGWPDLVLVRHIVIVAELKVGGNQPTAAQCSWLDAFQSAGVDAYLWHPSDWPEIAKVLTEVRP